MQFIALCLVTFMLTRFSYLSPLFSICKLTQNSPLGELITLLYCIVLYTQQQVM